MKEDSDRVRPEGAPTRFRRGRSHWPFDPRRHQSYVVSNQELAVPVAVTPDLSGRVRALQEALAQGDDGGIGNHSQRVVDGLCDAVGIARIPVRVGGRRLVRGGLEFYGFCGRNGFITLFSRTARRNHPVAFKTYLNTLVHEYMHHYDWNALQIQSMHTTGFYRRVRDVYDRLLKAI